jgi:aldehyde:ferredoxin oxidoreductase
MCAFLLDTPLADTSAENTAALLQAVTGMVFTPRQIVEVGERVNNLGRALEVRRLLSPGCALARQETTSDRRAVATRPSGCEEAEGPGLRAYFEARGWDAQTGIPLRPRLERLGLADVAGALEELAANERMAQGAAQRR